MSIIHNFKNSLKKNAPVLFLTGGIAGFYTAIYMTVKATPIALEALEEYAEHQEIPYKTDREILLDRFKILAPIYLPTIGVISISTILLLISNRVSHSRYEAVSGILMTSNQVLKTWQEKTLEKVGQKKTDEIRNEVQQSRVKSLSPEIILPEKILFYDIFSDRYFWADSSQQILKRVIELNDKMINEGFVSVNEFYYEMGLKPLGFGSDIGWNVENGSIELKFDSIIIQGTDRTCVAIEFFTQPIITFKPSIGWR